uniref:Uncharacterized protein LOC113796530 n=1 Tax=Dermatophagoides pteronyssinus TaxID=6956 RepID=A0A6P6YD65_DERPT|nr:uncharacterized protein LOC113796530 [Dermatophagoides pteronyssinus]
MSYKICLILQNLAANSKRELAMKKTYPGISSGWIYIPTKPIIGTLNGVQVRYQEHGQIKLAKIWSCMNTPVEFLTIMPNQILGRISSALLMSTFPKIYNTEITPIRMFMTGFNNNSR